MPRIEVIRPSDQPTGTRRLLGELRDALSSDSFTSARWVVAFTQLNPLLKLEKGIGAFRSAGGRVEVIYGVDHKGTTVEALEKSLALFDEVAIIHSPGRFLATFHPKFYSFAGPDEALFIVGSHNLTPGGTETNFEGSILITVDLPVEQDIYDTLMEIWTDADEISLELTRTLLRNLSDQGLLGSEADRQRKPLKARKAAGQKSDISFPSVITAPPETLPKQAKSTKSQQTVGPALGAAGLAIQIRPQHNGEVYLSKTAVNQDPAFFGFPFAGRTVPKFSHNKPYPQRDPDPKVNITIYDASGDVADELPNYDLNTVYYEPKSEIRVTISAPVAAKIPEYSIMVMQVSEEDDLDYVIDIFAPGSDDYDKFLALCDQKMPSGGKPQARKFGWF